MAADRRCSAEFTWPLSAVGKTDTMANLKDKGLSPLLKERVLQEAVPL
jgi:hypothetical protein